MRTTRHMETRSLAMAATGTTTSVLWKTTDAGVTWSPIDLQVLSALPANRELFAVTDLRAEFDETIPNFLHVSATVITKHPTDEWTTRGGFVWRGTTSSLSGSLLSGWNSSVETLAVGLKMTPHSLATATITRLLSRFRLGRITALARTHRHAVKPPLFYPVGSNPSLPSIGQAAI